MNDIILVEVIHPLWYIDGKPKQSRWFKYTSLFMQIVIYTSTSHKFYHKQSWVLLLIIQIAIKFEEAKITV